MMKYRIIKYTLYKLGIIMAKLLWGQVYYQEHFAGILQQEPSGRCVFTYDASYLSQKLPSIAYTLPRQEQPHICNYGLHPFFDNLIAEGWLQEAQAKALNVSPINHFALLLGFGFDLAGAVSLRDPDRQEQRSIQLSDTLMNAVTKSRASLSGVQDKIFLVQDNKNYRLPGPTELSTHIAKLPNTILPNIIELEYLSTLATQELLPDDETVELEINSIPEISEEALIIKRFDRTKSGIRKHFEEFNQLLGRRSNDKYDASYEEICQWVLNNPACDAIEVEKLYRRILAAFLIGNTDAHAKNYAMLYKQDVMTLTPAYDLVAENYYQKYKEIALSVAGAKRLEIGQLQAKHIVILGQSLNFSNDLIINIIERLSSRLPQTIEKISQSEVGSKFLREKLIEKMEKRWNGSFISIGKLLSKKRNIVGKKSA